tara:strand:- start:1906 stop:2085 length:180 start_codon:yes stop_codon:yes gene_type:complete
LAQIPTIKVKDGDGVKVINAADFDAAVHTAADEPVKSEPNPADSEPVAGKRKPGRPKKK